MAPQNSVVSTRLYPFVSDCFIYRCHGHYFGTLHLQEKGQQEALAFAKQRIQLRFANNSESLNTLNREIAASSEDPKLKQLVREQSNDLVQNNQEIIKVV
ncbi:hypothetical protein [Polynucleobacter necessarius]|uniref:hypothetical protein n=1 Tax=Polynucleobacter necessarius TaxID=576610 RepID=UPI0018D5027D|nr:hypothetical protein [Polynucleobacter necessarius]